MIWALSSRVVFDDRGGCCVPRCKRAARLLLDRKPHHALGIRVVQDAHGGGVKPTGLIQVFDEINLYRALWGWLHWMSDTHQRDFVTAPDDREPAPFRRTRPLLESQRRVFPRAPATPRGA